jgi:NADH pyrophosphatase NudC (nudix superfamily)
MTNEERIAEWLEQNEYCPQTGTTLPCTYPDDVMGCSKCEARSLLTFLRDELGFVQKDKDQSYTLINSDAGGKVVYQVPPGFVRVKSIVEGK